MYKRLKISPIPNDEVITSRCLGDDDDLYRMVYCDKDIDNIQVMSCKKCDQCVGVGAKEVHCGYERTNRIGN